MQWERPFETAGQVRKLVAKIMVMPKIPLRAGDVASSAA